MSESLTTIAEMTERVRKALDRHEFDRPLMAHLNEALFNQEFDAKRGAVFTARSVSVNTQTTGFPILVVYGEFTYKERTDSGAQVNVRQQGAWCRSSAWDGRNFAEMPEGARKRVAEMVSKVVLDIMNTPSHWMMLDREAAGGELESKINGSISESLRALERCLQVLGDD